jgi:hypothetical protein
MTWGVRVPLFGAGGFAGDDAAPEPVEVLIIHDSFDGMALNDDLPGRTPDVVNTPGNNWAGPANQLESDGAGRIRSDAVNDDAYIDTGITDNRIKAEVIVNKAADNETNLFILSDGVDNGGLPNDMLELQQDDPVTILQRRVAGSFSTIASTSLSTDVDTNFTKRIQFDGTDVKVFIDDVEITALTQEGFAVPAGLDGNSFAGFRSGNPTSATLNSFWDDFKVWDLP